jgi:nitrogen fixation protein FixH
VKAAKLWPIAIVGVLALTVGLNVVVFWAASDPDAEAVEPDYYRKAVDWDRTLAQRRHDADLGWTLDAAIAPLAADGSGELRMNLADRSGGPISGAEVRIEAIHNAVAAHPLVAEAVTGTDGVAIVRLPLRRRGIWELRCDVTRGAEHFTATLRRAAVRGPAR